MGVKGLIIVKAAFVLVSSLLGGNSADSSLELDSLTKPHNLMYMNLGLLHLGLRKAKNKF